MCRYFPNTEIRWYTIQYDSVFLEANGDGMYCCRDGIYYRDGMYYRDVRAEREHKNTFDEGEIFRYCTYDTIIT